MLASSVLENRFFQNETARAVEMPMRRYMQGTLDFTCAVYAVINSLSVIHNLDLATGRMILAETLQAL